MASTVTKYIIIPEYAPLYAMRRCFGPNSSPLSKPTKTPVDVIGELLLQTGKEKVSIYEVTPLDNGSFSAPVQLSLENYMLPYDQISGHDVVVDKKVASVEVPLPETVTITPVITESAEPVEDEKKLDVIDTKAEDEVPAATVDVEQIADAEPAPEVSSETVYSVESTDGSDVVTIGTTPAEPDTKSSYDTTSTERRTNNRNNDRKNNR